MSEFLLEQITDLSADFNWGPSDVLVYLCDLLTNSEMGDQAIAWLWHCGRTEQELRCIQEAALEAIDEEFRADQGDQDFMQTYEVDEP